jgi:hypothetical protein
VRKNEQGFSLAELLVAGAIAGLLMGAIATILFQMSTIGSSGNDRLTICHELQKAASQLETDGVSALSATGGNSLVLSYPSGTTITYSLSGRTLQRTSTAGANVLAQNITSLSFTVTGRLVNMQITSSVSGRTLNSEQISCLVNLRPSAP